ncbi:LEAF RUST 10 DISEASE-RESISTANCE LOCUS RECEPTOR-LIKE PROTEIN KINASE-like 2.4 isoform X2 [Lotus japonicus]|uniref:LEAF RUST 10 DISEASE-RESISTANCE LOCUS RECEPTOR-LIKE PROTEIN KINASE-like 2.4 isoform X2 n=1 Tax=Lotus japonicus TaxID=34305 RepID=UPI002583CB29|nr:LEAF RUST 10 DISEASE-RESISTANCE LOCUS RECEPTOR-LIKE PROTEIN KINASE-like 2.4 isoform X2 [Lotus japonicus]
MCVRMDEHIHIHVRFSMLFPSIFTSITLCLFLLTCTLPQSHSQQPLSPPLPDYYICKDSSYNCGNLTGISYPFWGQNRPSNCGGGDMFNLTCHPNLATTVLIASQNFTVLDINPYTLTMTMKRTDFNVCSPKQFDDTFLIGEVFQYATSVSKITIFYNCSNSGKNFSGCGQQKYAFGHVDMDLNEEELKRISKDNQCTGHIKVPVGFSLEPYYEKGVIDRDDLEQGLDKGFEVKYYVNPDCMSCLGREEINCPWRGDDFDKQVASSCHYCSSRTNAASHCPVPIFIPTPTPTPTPTTASPKRKVNWSIKLIIGATTAGLSICFTIFYFICKSSSWHGKFCLKSKSNLDIEAFLKNQGALTTERYKFSYVKKITDSFKVKLGQGGFGAVYKGKLPTGSLVAVKILNSSKGNGQDFVNEVASISRTSHVNIVNLLGFCLEGQKKALIYEFMPNGSLDKFIYQKGPENIASLSWQNLYQIAIGIARGLEYLHKGCNTRILHFDIKPHNILLDENFCPKISDFGLAKLCPRKESIISMSDARGTMGYVAPELWNRHFGGVSHKADVYSYGMMLLEMVGGRKNINAEASHTSEIYFPHWVYNRLELGSDLGLNGVMAQEDNEIAGKMTLVGLWCIQTIPNDRPAMSKVIDMLERNIDSLEIPPKPILSSPTRSMPKSSTISCEFP